ncbi:hypothetical protein ACFLQ1_01950 [Candidatus Auribacterota bacterium]
MEPFLTKKEIEQVSRYIIKKIIDKKIFIEFNPTSNKLVSRHINSINDHPLTKLIQSDFVINGEDFSELKSLVTINTDDAGMMGMESVKDEFITLGTTLLRSGSKFEKVKQYLKILADNGRKRGELFAFGKIKSATKTLSKKSKTPNKKNSNKIEDKLRRKLQKMQKQGITLAVENLPAIAAELSSSITDTEAEKEELTIYRVIKKFISKRNKSQANILPIKIIIEKAA